MKQGTTTTFKVKQFDLPDITEIIFSFTNDKNNVVVERTTPTTDDGQLHKSYPSEVSLEDGYYKIGLDQDETLKLEETFYVEAQIMFSGAVTKAYIDKVRMPHTFYTKVIDGATTNGEEIELEMELSDVIEIEGGSTGDYTDLTNKPKINNIELIGNKTSSDLGLASASDLNSKADKSDTYTKSETNNLLSGKQNTITGGNGIDVSSDVVSVDLRNTNDILGFTQGQLMASPREIAIHESTRRYLVSTDYNYPLASKEYVDNLISGRLKRLVVESLPTQDIDTNTIYMILKSAPTTNNIYDEYMYINNAWELIGSTEVDLSNYYTKTESDNRYNPKLSTTNGLVISNDYSTINVLIQAPSYLSNFLAFEQNSGGLYIDTYNLSHDSDFRSGLTSDAYNNPLQPLITTTSKLSADKVNDSNTTNKFVPTHSSTESGKVLGVDNQGALQWVTSGGGSYSGGDGIDITNDTISVDLKSGSKLQFDNGELDVDLSSKEDKTTISTDTSSTTVSLTLADNHEYRYTQDLTSLTLTMPSGDFISSIVFASGSTPTSMTYDSSIKWSGDDVTNGQFVPSADKDYDIMMYYNGLNVNGIVRGV